MIKILIISSEFPPGPGGIGAHAYNIANELYHKGNKVTVCTVSDYASPEDEKAFDIKCNFIVLRFVRYKNIFLNYFTRIILILKTINHNCITHVLCTGRFSIWIIIFLKFFKFKKIVAVLHGSEVGHGLKRKWLCFNLSLANQIISVSSFSKNLLPPKLKSRARVIHNGINLDQWDTTNIKSSLKQFPILLTVGSISYRKGQHNVVSAIPEIKKIFPNVHYHCVGPEREKKYLLKKIKQLSVGAHVTLNGVLTHSNLENIYAKAHINMMLSDQSTDGDVEGYGISVLEGNAFGIPAIGSINSGLREAISPRVNGLLVNSKNQLEIVEAIKRIYTNYRQYSKLCQEYASNKLWSQQITLYEKYIF